MGLSVKRLAQENDVSCKSAAQSLINLLRKGLVTPDDGNVEGAIRDLEEQIKTSQYR